MRAGGAMGQESAQEMKKGPAGGQSLPDSEVLPESGGDDVGRTRALLALADRKLDFLPFVECGVALHPDFGMVNEQIVAAIVRSNESVTLVCVEPFDRACTHLLFSLGPPSLPCAFPLLVLKE